MKTQTAHRNKFNKYRLCVFFEHIFHNFCAVNFIVIHK